MKDFEGPERSEWGTEGGVEGSRQCSSDIADEHDCLFRICRSNSLLCGAQRAEDRSHARSEHGSVCFCRAAVRTCSLTAVGNRPASPACLYAAATLSPGSSI